MSTQTAARIADLVRATGHNPRLYAITATARMIDETTDAHAEMAARGFTAEADAEFAPMSDHEILVYLDEQVEDDSVPFLTEEHRLYLEGLAA